MTDKQAEFDLEQLAASELGEDPPEGTSPETLLDDPKLFHDLANRLEGVIEALIFASPDPIGVEGIMGLFVRAGCVVAEQDVEAAIARLLSRYSEQSSERFGLELSFVAGGYVFRTRSVHGPFVRLLFKGRPQKLSTSVLEVLAIAAYRQPITRAEIEGIRGVDCSAAMRKLLGLKLIKILGKSQAMGRPLLYGTTKQFLEFFGLNSLHDLPTLREFEELNKETAPKDEVEETRIKVMDLFAGHDHANLVSEEMEKLSHMALQNLDKALHTVANVAEKLHKEGSFSEKES